MNNAYEHQWLNILHDQNVYIFRMKINTSDKLLTTRHFLFLLHKS